MEPPAGFSGAGFGGSVGASASAAAAGKGAAGAAAGAARKQARQREAAAAAADGAVDAGEAGEAADGGAPPPQRGDCIVFVSSYPLTTCCRNHTAAAWRSAVVTICNAWDPAGPSTPAGITQEHGPVSPPLQPCPLCCSYLKHAQAIILHSTRLLIHRLSC